MNKSNLQKLAQELGLETLSEEIESDINAKLDRAAKLDEVDTVTFGLETDDGQVVKVFVNEKDAAEFEKIMADCLGSTDSIEDAINKAAAKVDIIDVEWPSADSDEDEETLDGSEVLDPKVYSKANLDKEVQSGLKTNLSNATVTEAQDSATIANKFSTSNQQLVYQAIIDLGIPEEALNRSAYRASIVKGIRETALLLQASPSLKTALKLFIKKRVDLETKENKEKEKTNESVFSTCDSMVVENIGSDLYWEMLINLIKALDSSVEKKVSAAFLGLQVFETLRMHTISLKISTQIKTKLRLLNTAINEMNELKAGKDATKLGLDESLSTVEIVDSLTKLISFINPKDTNIAEKLLGTSQFKAVLAQVKRNVVHLTSDVKLALARLLEAIAKTEITESFNNDDGFQLGDFKFLEAEAEKALKAFTNKVTTVVTAACGTKLVLSPRPGKSFLKEVGGFKKSDITPDQIENIRSSLF